MTEYKLKNGGILKFVEGKLYIVIKKIKVNKVWNLFVNIGGELLIVPIKNIQFTELVLSENQFYLNIYWEGSFKYFLAPLSGEEAHFVTKTLVKTLNDTYPWWRAGREYKYRKIVPFTPPKK